MRKWETPDWMLDPPDDEPEIPGSGISPNFDNFFDWLSDLAPGTLEHSIVSKAITEQSIDAWRHAIELLQEHIDRTEWEDFKEKERLFCEECNQ